MRPSPFLVAAALAVLLAWPRPGDAAIDAASPNSATRLELLVFEHPDCVSCRIFRRDVLPKYRFSSSAEQVPLRFVDIAQTDIDAMPLRSRIDTVPTAVVMKDGSEVDRIVGYWGPDNFFKLLKYILARTE